MDIGFYIADLLRSQDEVSLPEFGTFTKERVAGSYDRSSNSFSPPSYQVGFSSDITDINSLIEYVSRKKNLSLSSAEYFVKKFAAGLSELLQRSGSAEVKPLGSVRKNNDTLSFQTANDFQVAGKFYGLQPLADLVDNNVTPEITKEPEPVTHTEPAIVPNPTPVSETVPPVETTVPPAEEPGHEPVSQAVTNPFDPGSIEDFISNQGREVEADEQVFEEEPRRSRTGLIILIALLLVTLTVISLYLFNPTAKSLVRDLFLATASNTNIPAAIDSSVVNTQPILDSVSTAAASPSAASATIVDPASPITVSTPAPEIERTTVEIIGAAFGKRTDADKYVKDMKSKGLNARILDNMPGPLIKVSLGSFPDFKSAEGELSRIRRDINPQAWPFNYKNKKTQ